MIKLRRLCGRPALLRRGRDGAVLGGGARVCARAGRLVSLVAGSIVRGTGLVDLLVSIRGQLLEGVAGGQDQIANGAGRGIGALGSFLRLPAVAPELGGQLLAGAFRLADQLAQQLQAHTRGFKTM